MSRSQLVDDACHLINTVRSGALSFTECEPTAAVSLARVTAMLAVYGSKDEAILHVIHEKGHTEVTLSDVVHVRAFVLGEAKPEESLEDIISWPCGDWAYREDLYMMQHKSDDYEVLYFGTPEYINFRSCNGLD